MCWNGERGKSFDEFIVEEAIKVIHKVTEDKRDSFEEVGAAMIGFMFGIPTKMSQQAIDEMKQKQEVKDIINKYKQCLED